MDEVRSNHPLTWPAAQPRRPVETRKHGRFKTTFGQTRTHLLDELRRLGASSVILSSNLPVRRDGLPYADYREPVDPGVAVYFRNRTGAEMVIACDTYREIVHNLRALGVTVEALRSIQRHGSTELMEQAMRGFAALPAPRTGPPAWWSVLGISSQASVEEIRIAWKTKAREFHPDNPGGGNLDRMSEVNAAYTEAKKERGVTE